MENNNQDIKNVMAPEHKIKAFNPEDDVFAGKTDDELRNELGKSGVEKVKGRISEDAITGERVSSSKIEEGEDDVIKSLQELEPTQIKKHLTGMVKDSLKFMLEENALTEEEIDEVISDLENKLVDVTIEEIKKMDSMSVKMFFGTDLYNTIKQLHPKDCQKLTKQLLIDFKEGIVEFNGVVDTMDEMNKHLKFFKENDIESLSKETRDEVEAGDSYETEFHKYLRYLELYLVKLQSKEEYKDNRFMQEEIAITNNKLAALKEALEFTQIFNKCEAGGHKLLKDFKDPALINKTVCDFLGKLYNDPTISVSFPLPKNFDPKVKKAEALTSVWVAFLEMVMLKKNFPAVANLTGSQYMEMVRTVLGLKNPNEVDEIPQEGKLDIAAFVTELNIRSIDIEEARKGAIIISYVVARTFKPSRLNDTHQKYVLSYTMNILTQGLINGNESLIKTLTDGVTERLAKIMQEQK